MINITYRTGGTIISWGVAVTNPNLPNILFKENVELPVDFDGINYLFLNDEFVKIEENDN